MTFFSFALTRVWKPLSNIDRGCSIRIIWLERIWKRFCGQEIIRLSQTVVWTKDTQADRFLTDARSISIFLPLVSGCLTDRGQAESNYRNLESALIDGMRSPLFHPPSLWILDGVASMKTSTRRLFLSFLLRSVRLLRGVIKKKEKNALQSSYNCSH